MRFGCRIAVVSLVSDGVPEKDKDLCIESSKRGERPVQRHRAKRVEIAGWRSEKATKDAIPRSFTVEASKGAVYARVNLVTTEAVRAPYAKVSRQFGTLADAEEVESIKQLQHVISVYLCASASTSWTSVQINPSFWFFHGQQRSCGLLMGMEEKCGRRD
ncbi:hypothetical protein MUK42_35848 [Musa troglodytarum]|uniref:Uncharacterized protein n=1 Tax=Musa troglodytarum TaxID=320322 RepID=A0A9E7FEQ9_9LILI|nr:hypothetical protein MUK42_35848 [Musa troglodytarum]